MILRKILFCTETSFLGTIQRTPFYALNTLTSIDHRLLFVERPSFSFSGTKTRTGPSSDYFFFPPPFSLLGLCASSRSPRLSPTLTTLTRLLKLPRL